MSTLSKVISGKVFAPELILQHGIDGVGKTTWASKAPKPIFIDIEDGTRRLDVARFPRPTCFRDVLQNINDLALEKHDYGTLVIDTVDWLEKLIWAQACQDEGVNNIEQIGGGWGKWKAPVNNLWGQFKRGLDAMRAKTNMHVIMLAHSFPKAFNDPQTNAAYDRYILKMHAEAAAFLREWAETVLFANYKTVLTGNEKAVKKKAYGDGSRRLYTQWRPAFDAKNRNGLPFELVYDWDEYVRASSLGESEKAENIIANIEELLKDSSDEAFKAVVRKTYEGMKGNVSHLVQAQDRLRARLEKESEQKPIKGDV